MKKEIRTRFAPSPTGYMHIGNLRTALYAYLIAKHQAGKFILRIEDTDQTRKVEDSLEVIYKNLDIARIHYDEGPDRDGGYGPYVQSRRKAIYKKYIETLLESGYAYRCFCTKEELEQRREQSEAQDQYKYDGKCRLLSAAEIREKLEAGLSSVVRQKIPRQGSTTFKDHVFGEITIENQQLDDQVLLKADGFPTYNFANVIDDHLMAITHVVRGVEYLSSTPKYNLLYKAFGWDIPHYIHLPLIVKEGGKKLSKREGDASFEDFLTKGYLPEAIINYIALLGWNPGTEQEFFTLEDLTSSFDIDQISKSSAAFSEEKLKWINGLHIRNISAEAFHALAEKQYPAQLAEKMEIRKVSALLQKRVEQLNEIPQMVAFLSQLPDYDIALFEHKKMKSTTDSAALVLKELLQLISTLDPWENGVLYQALIDYAKKQGYKNGTVLWPLRIALSGQQSSPGGATELAEILGREETLSRIRQALKKLE